MKKLLLFITIITLFIGFSGCKKDSPVVLNAIKRTDLITYKVIMNPNLSVKATCSYWNAQGIQGTWPNFTITNQEWTSFWASGDGVHVGIGIFAPASLPSRIDIQILVNGVVARSGFVDSQHLNCMISIPD